MSLKKRVSKSMALALVGVTVLTSTIATVNAAEINDVSSSNQEISISSYNEVESHIKEIYGSEDEFVTASVYENTYTEVNGAKGIIRVKKIDEFGNEDIIFETNIYDSAKEISYNLSEDNESKIEPRESIAYKKQMTGSPIDKYSIAVYSHGNYKSDYRIQIGSKRGQLSSYYKSKSWDTGNTAKFKTSLLKAQGNVKSIKGKIVKGALFASAMSVLNKYLIGTGQIDKAAVIALLQTVGVTAVTATAVGVDAVSYLINARNCGDYYNLIIKGSR